MDHDTLVTHSCSPGEGALEVRRIRRLSLGYGKREWNLFQGSAKGERVHQINEIFLGNTRDLAARLGM